MHHLLDVDPEVKEALRENHPVVALESTVISHGLPYPDNLEVTEAMKASVRKQGAIPAVIGVRQGLIKVGMGEQDIEHFARKKAAVLKLSRADLAYCLSLNLDGASTVSATLFSANLAGIKVFATGGLGGVHRHAEQSFDISADLMELSKTPVLVVCSGAKAILDVPKTLEYLETHGVPVVGFQCDTFPLFYARTSRYSLHKRAEKAAQIAHIAQTHWQLSMGGLVLANPIPQEAALDADVMERMIAQATEESLIQGISGKQLTPFLLERLSVLSGGQSLAANKALLVSNAALAAQVAAAF